MECLQGAQGSSTSLYVHIPFCAVKCGYCDFNSFVDPSPLAHDRFLLALEKEMRLACLPVSPPSIFIGGGTPSQLDADRLGRLLSMLGHHVDLAGCPEITMEVNPESVSQEKVSVARASGVGRISMGVQSFNADRLRFLDRPHDGHRVVEAVREIRAAGIENLSLDLIFGVPGQSPADWRLDLDQALALKPNHISCYNLTYEQGTRLYRDLQQGRLQPNTDESDLEMFLETRRVLQSAGFKAYEVSNFAGDGGACRHNDHYWNQGDYVGVGPGACSHRSGVRVTNLKSLDGWSAAVDAGHSPASSAETLSPRQRAGEALWLGLRRSAGVDLAAIEQRLDFPLRLAFDEVLSRHVHSGCLVCESSVVSLTDRGLLVADSIGADFLF